MDALAVLAATFLWQFYEINLNPPREQNVFLQLTLIFQIFASTQKLPKSSVENINLVYTTVKKVIKKKKNHIKGLMQNILDFLNKFPYWIKKRIKKYL